MLFPQKKARGASRRRDARGVTGGRHGRGPNVHAQARELPSSLGVRAAMGV
jgi:hypothetical protein